MPFIPVISRAEFQAAAQTRLHEARILWQAGLFDGAYYLGGYAVELALKAVIIRRLMETDRFPEKNFSTNCYKHDLDMLLRLAGLDDELSLDPALRLKWDVVRAWTEQSRYGTHWTEQEARDLLDAIDSQDGVLRWLRNWY